MAIEILVVEDEYAERQELSRIMEEITPTHHIRSASSCAAAVSAIKQLCPDLILLDIMLRGSSGFEVAEFVRSRGLACRIIILTAYHEFEFASRALSMGLQDYLLKPVRPFCCSACGRYFTCPQRKPPARRCPCGRIWPAA